MKRLALVLVLLQAPFARVGAEEHAPVRKRTTPVRSVTMEKRGSSIALLASLLVMPWSAMAVVHRGRKPDHKPAPKSATQAGTLPPAPAPAAAPAVARGGNARSHAHVNAPSHAPASR